MYDKDYYKKHIYGYENEQRSDHSHILEILEIKENDKIYHKLVLVQSNPGGKTVELTPVCIL